MSNAKEPSKHIWAYQLLGLACAAFGIWQGWTMREYPDLQFMASLSGVAACWAMIAIGRGKL
jgi:hypothetical protein